MSKKNRHQAKIHTPNTESLGTSLDGLGEPPLIKLAICVFILILATLIVYIPSLKVPFLLDDYGKIVRNPDIKSLENIPSRLIYPYKSPLRFHRNDPSRPLTYLTLTFNYHFNQLNPYGYHMVNIATHIAVVLLIFILGLLIFPIVGLNGIVLPFLSALLFSVHPINVNVVTYVIGRAASLATIFYLSAVIMFIRARRGFKLGIPISAACFVLALGSNQLALTLPAMILAVDLCFFSEENLRPVAQYWNRHGIYWAILAIYLSARFIYFGTVGDVEATKFSLSPIEYFLTQWVVLWKYAGMVVWPTGLSFEHTFGSSVKLTDPRFLTATILYAVLLLVLIKGLKSSWQSVSLVLFGVLWFFITVSPTSSFFPTTAIVAENRIYLPSIGLCLILPFMGYVLIRRMVSEHIQSMVLLVVFCFYCLPLGFLTYHRNILYQDPVGIWSDVIQRYPDHQRAHKNLAIEFYKQGKHEEMAAECEKALTLDPTDFDARNNLAAAYYNLGRYKKALATYQEIVKEKPDYAPGYSNMGMLLEDLKNVEAAINAYQNAIRLDPMLIEPLNNLGNIYLHRGQYKEAATLYQAALKIDPNNEPIRKNFNLIPTNNR